MKKSSDIIICVMMGLLGFSQVVDAAALSQTRTKTSRRAQETPTPRAREDQLVKVQERVDALETQMSQLMGIVIPGVENALSSVVKSKAQSDSATIMLIHRINLLQNKIKILEDKLAYADSTNFEVIEQLMMIENKIVTLTRSFNELYTLRTGKPVGGAQGMASDEFKRNYVNALNLYQNGDFQKAIGGFAALVRSSPQHELADNSQYWLAECYYSLRNYKRAILEFQKVLQFSDKDKWDDAQLKLGLCHQRIGNRQKARDEFQKLLDLYPGSEYYQKAQQYLRQL